MFTDDEMDQVFHALAHGTRRDILDHLRITPGLTVGGLAAHFDVSRIAVMNHISVLENSRLVVSEKEGRTRRLHLNIIPIQMIYDRWGDVYSQHWASKLTTIKYAAEQAAKKKDQA